VHNILVKDYKGTQWKRELHNLHIYHIHFYYFIQTLIFLSLDNNQIGDKGAQYLGEGLQKNTVRENCTIFIFMIFIFIISYRHSQNSTSTATISEIKVHSILVKDYKGTQWKRERVTLFSSSSLLFHTDTHYTLPVKESNWR
jgi:hypothetical protein